MVLLGLYWLCKSFHPTPIFRVGDGGEKDKGPCPWQHLPKQHLIEAITLLLEGDGVGSDEEPVSMGSSEENKGQHACGRQLPTS